MALIHSLEKNGNFLFRYRGEFPLMLFLMAVPVIYFTDYSFIKENQTLYIILTAIAIFVSFLGQFIRAVAIGTSQKLTSGRNKHEQVAEALNTKGIYSVVRHPLYLGNYFMWTGIVLFTFNIWFVVLSGLMFWIYYERIMFAEERFLERKFGQSYVDWSMKVPAFLPNFKQYKKTDIPFSFKTILRREYSGISATIIGFLFVDFFRQLFLEKELRFHMYQAVVLGIAIFYSLILRTLKHNTEILHEEDRS